MTARRLTACALLAAALVLSACGSGDDTASTGSTSAHGGGHSSSDSTTDPGKANEADVAFLSGMTPHHEQAVEMSEIVLAANPPAEVAAIATEIQNAQAPEIEQMTSMLEDLGESSDTGSHGEGQHQGGHGGMMSDAYMAQLRSATGTEAARLYLEGMIEHHEGAIEASETQIAEGQYRPAIELARKIAADQAAEITRMRELLADL